MRRHSFTIDGSFRSPTAASCPSARRPPAATWPDRSAAPADRHGGQVADARVGMVSGFGMINYDRGLCTAAAILARSDA